MALEGFDLASHQGPGFPMARAYAEGRRFAIIKASGGHTYQNEYRAAQVAAARAAGLLVGFYHYQFEPLSGGGVMEREVANFLDAIAPFRRPGDTCWLDVEEYPASVGFGGDLGGWIDGWCAAVDAALGCRSGVYCATWYLEPTGLTGDARLARRPFWMASWQAEPPAARYLAPWDRLTVWQYGADGAVAGVAPMDEDRFFGDEADWRALGIGGASGGSAPVGVVRPPRWVALGPFGYGVGGGFREYYEAEPRALELWGWPVTEEFRENGLTVQYFERARFEWHPELGRVLLGLLGSEARGK